VLTRLIDLNDFRYGLIFCSTKVMVDELDEQLHSRGYATDRLHGDLSQMQRNRVMEKFRNRSFEFLVATDVAARGLDVDDLEVVFNFDLPNDAEDYTHRIGRTARAGKSGRAVTFVSGRELYKLQGMVRFANLKIRRESVPSLDQVEEARASVFFERLRGLLDSGQFEKHDRMIDRLLDQGYASTDICSALIQLLRGGPAPKAAPSQARPSAQAPARDPGPEPEPEAEADGPEAAPVVRTGKEAGMTTLFFNAGRKHLVTTAEIVGKVTGVTRLPANVIGAIDIHQRHALVDVAADQAPLIMKKMTGIRIRGHAIKASLATTEEKARD
jgi:ATP-dependent RNA helicase DeaD